MLETKTRLTVLLPLNKEASVTTNIPIAANDNTTAIEAICEAILNVTGGYTAKPVSGGWRDDNGTTYYDASIEVYTYCTYAQAERLLELAKQWALDLGQLVLAVELAIVNVAMVTGVTVKAAL